MINLVNIIVSFIGTILSVILTYYMDKKRIETGRMVRIGWINYIVSVFIGAALGLLIGILLISPFLNPPPEGWTTSIEKPEANSKISQKIYLSGKSQKLPIDHDLWIFVYPLDGPSYHPQSGPISLGSNGDWNSVAYVGVPGNIDSGKKFELILTMAEKSATEDILKYLNESETKNSYPGYPTLPNNITELNRITVIRN